MLNLLRKSAARREGVRRLYDDLVARARAPVFFREFGVPDTVDGRFDMIVLHAWLALARLGAAGEEAAAQALTNTLFTGFDEALREQGAGDMGLSRRIKAMGDAFFGRLHAYDGAQDRPQLAAALARNLYRGAPVDARALALADYAASARAALERSPPGRLDFGPPPSLETA